MFLNYFETGVININGLCLLDTTYLLTNVIIVRRRGSDVKRNATSTDSPDYYNMTNTRHIGDVTTSDNNTYQQLQLPRPLDPSTLYSHLIPTASK